MTVALSRFLWGPRTRAGLGVGLAVFAADQLHKWWMISVYDIGARGKVAMGPFLDLVMVWNRGVSYGLFAQHGDLGRYVLAAFAVVAALALTAWLARAETRLAALSLGLIIGGALANGLDRINYGAVADFFSFHAMGFYWYVFNIADVAIVAGVAGLLFDSFVKRPKNALKEK